MISPAGVVFYPYQEKPLVHLGGNLGWVLALLTP